MLTRKCPRILAAAVLLCLTQTGHARGVSPYLPLKLAPEVERDVERVLILGGSAVLSRPIATARVLDALPVACQHDRQLCLRVRRFLSRYMEPIGSPHTSVELSTAEGTHPMPNRHGLPLDSEWNVSSSGYFQWGDYLLINGGIVAYDDETSAAGSFLSLGFEYVQLDVGYRDHWLSPMTDSAMILSSNATTMPSVTFSNYAPISSWGIRYELFLAEMSHSDNIAHEGGTTSGKPRLGGLHLSFEPAAGWALGVNRLVQFGGGERGGDSFGDFLRALFKPHDYDNASDASQDEFGNQTAAWTSRMIFDGETPFSVYFEYAGEDASYSGNYRLGNAALSMGIDIPRIWNSFDFTYEVSEWQNGWYVHHIYGDGLTNEGRGVGHWFGDQRRLNDGVGGQSHMARLGWDTPFGGIAELRYRTLLNESYTQAGYTRAHELMLRYSHPWRSLLVGGEVLVGRDVFGEEYSRVAGFARFGGDFSDFSYESEDEKPDSTEYFVDAGASASKVRIMLGDGSIDKYVTDFAYAPHLALGARRSVSERSDLGARLEFDQIEDELLISVRALDYRYRWGKHFATSFFAGASRFDLATPAFGYYGGLGLHWRDLARHLDLSVDIRYGDKYARDKLLPSDPATNPRPDLFYDLMGATLYLSYKL